MAEKQLTAKVRLNIDDVEKKINRLNQLFDSINKNVNKASGGNAMQNATKKATAALTEYDRAAQRLSANREKAQRKEYENWWKTTLAQQDAINKELELEKARQRSVKALGDGDKAAQRMARNAEKIKRAEYEAWWQATLVKQEYQKAHPILSRLSSVWEKIRSHTQKANGNTSKLTGVFNKASTVLSNIKNKVREWAVNQKAVNSTTRSTNSVLGSVWNRLKGIAATYLGIMGMKSMVNATDTITSAENKINYISSNQLGNAGKNADGTYSTKTLNATQDAMDKMYASSQKVRMGYADMMTNVSKMMTLAPDAFQGTIDNAIRFQEIMAESYALGGASAEEMSTSMYQLTQALGAGTLAGDELRSVREGAPLAYQAIEEFVQGVYNTEESLKELGSQGKVTSDMVVAAIMNMGKEADSAFAQTQQTFAQTWDQIKNAALRAFDPVGDRLREALTKALDNGMISKFETFFTAIANVMLKIFDWIGNAVSWIAENWGWLKHIVVGALIVICSYMLVMGAISIATAVMSAILFIKMHWQLLLIVAAIAIIIYALYLWQAGVISTSDLILICIGIVIAALLILAFVFNSIPLLIIAGILLVLTVVFIFFGQVCGGAWVVATFIGNLMQTLANIIVGILLVLLTFIFNVIALVVNSVMAGAMAIGTLIQWVVAFIVNLVMAMAMAIGTVVQWIVAFIVNLATGCANSVVALSHNAVALITNVAMGLGNSIGAICQNIGIAFQNAWTWAKNTFWEFIADVLRGISKLEPVINGIAGLLGKKGVDFGSVISGIEGKKGEYKSFVSVGNAWSGGMDTVAYKDVSDSWSKGWNTMDYANIGNMVSKGWNTMDFANMGDMVSKGWNTMEFKSIGDAWSKGSSIAGTGLSDWSISDAYKTGFAFGDNFKNSVVGGLNKWGSEKASGLNDKLSGLGTGLKDKIGSLGITDSSGLGSLSDIADKLGGASDPTGGKAGSGGTGSKGSGSGFPNVSDPAYSVADSYKMPSNDELLAGLGDLSDIKDNTGAMADSMELSEEDLRYLRDVANMEWKKEFTTAEIHVEMNNNNTVNGESDLDGLVTKLSEKLYEELDAVANGVYA